MGYILLQYAPWFVAIFAVGAAMAFFVRQAGLRDRTAPWLVWCAFAFALALVLALLGAVQGRAGVWLETGVFAFASYMAGAGAVALARRGDFSEHDGWALGLLPAALLWFGANAISGPRVEANLTKSVQAALADVGEKTAQVTVDGRDVTLRGVAEAERSKLVAMASHVDGVRTLRADGKTVVEPFTTTSSEPSAEKGVVEKSAEAAQAAAKEAEAAAKRAAEEAKLASARAMLAAASPADRIRTARDALRALPSGVPLDAAQCQAGLDATLAISKIEFNSGSSRIRYVSTDALDRLAALLKRCPDKKAEIAGHTDNVGKDEDNQALSQRRADAVVDYLARGGVAKDRLSGVGYGASKPIASNATDEGQAENRRIEIILR